MRAAGVAKGRALVGLGDQPAYVLIAIAKWAPMPVEDMLIPALSRFTFGQLHDAVVCHDNVPECLTRSPRVAQHYFIAITCSTN